MKTLDEMIKVFEAFSKECSDLYEGPAQSTVSDALHYLKEYKIKRERIMAKAQDCEDTEKHLQDEIARYQEAVQNCEVTENKYKRLCEETSQNLVSTSQNDPLTWDELKTMKGKPMWIEPCKEWMLITDTEDDDLWLLSLDGSDYEFTLHEWQAYRKEKA